MCTVLEEQNSREDEMSSLEMSNSTQSNRAKIKTSPLKHDNDEDQCFIVFNDRRSQSRSPIGRQLQTLTLMDDDDDDIDDEVVHLNQMRTDTTTPTYSISSSSGYEGNSLSQTTTTDAPGTGTPISNESVPGSNPSSLSMPSSTTGSGDEYESEESAMVNVMNVSKLETIPDWMVVGESVRISPDSKLGVIAFIGETQFSSGIWIGVILDTPTGKNDGTVNGVAYFECKPKFGIFVKPDKLKCDPKGRALRQTATKVNGNRK